MDYKSKYDIKTRYKNKINIVKSNNLKYCDIGNIIKEYEYVDKNCKVCSVNNKKNINNLIINKNKELIKFLKYKDDAYEYTIGSHKRVLCKCPDCGYESEIEVSNLNKYGYRCKKCGDGISYPNKFMLNLLQYIKVEFIPEYSPPWCKYKYKDKIKKGRYDFYIPSKNLIIEMDGGLGHGNYNKLNGQTAKESKEIDNHKDKLANDNGIKVVRIDCKYIDLESRFEYIKNNILNSKLNEIFNFNDVDWKHIMLLLSKSINIAICKYWDDNYENLTTKDLEKIFNTNINKIRNALKMGTEMNILKHKYDPYLEKLKGILLKENGKLHNKYTDIFLYNYNTKELLLFAHFQKDIAKWAFDNGFYSTYDTAKKGINYIIKHKNGIHTFKNNFKILITYNKL